MVNILSFPALAWLGALVLRVVIGAIFIIHGKAKIGMWKASPSEQMPASMLNIMKALSVVETLGGILLILGFWGQASLLGVLSQLSAIALAVVMLGAIYFKIKKWNTPFTTQSSTGWEFDLVLLAGLVSLFLSI